MACGNSFVWLLIAVTVTYVSGAWRNFFTDQYVSAAVKPSDMFGHKKPTFVKRETKHGPSVQTEMSQPASPVVSEAKPEAMSKQRWQPVPAESVSVQCGETGVHVEVKQDFLGNNQPIQLAQFTDLTLGGCEATGVDTDNQLIIFDSDLQACGSQLTMTEDFLVYTFALSYKPSALLNTPIVKTNEAVALIECYYVRRQNVSSSSLEPTWMPYSSSIVETAEGIYFSLSLMTEDWESDRPSHQYYLGNAINIEASIIEYNHMPLRIFVDHCVATPEPDANAEPSYHFIRNLGCFVDAKLTGSSSQFLPRSRDNKLRIRLEAFRFHEQHGDTIYITCHMRAQPLSSTSVHKACSFIDGWRSADRNDEVCSCCETSCPNVRKSRDVSTADPGFEGDLMLGPIEIKNYMMQLRLNKSV